MTKVDKLGMETLTLQRIAAVQQREKVWRKKQEVEAILCHSTYRATTSATAMRSFKKPAQYFARMFNNSF